MSGVSWGLSLLMIFQPLLNLIHSTEKCISFHWRSAERNAWNTLKLKLTSTPVLAYPDSTLPFDTDASEYGIGAVLCQVQGGEERVICYVAAPIKLEQRYCVTHKEMLACVFFVRHFHNELDGFHSTLCTDQILFEVVKEFPFSCRTGLTMAPDY